MGRKSAQDKEKTHQKIVKAAGALFRSKGYVATGIDVVMKKADLTAGGFYKHFKSKDDLLCETIEHVFRDTFMAFFGGIEALKGPEWLETIVKRYTSRSHRDGVSEGCMIPALSAEVARESSEVREVFEREILKMIATIEEHAQFGSKTEGSNGRAEAIKILATIVGAISLARAVRDPSLSDEILLTCRKQILRQYKRS